jgi:hypothetical protein
MCLFAAMGTTYGIKCGLFTSKTHLRTPSGWFVDELGWHEHNTLATTTKPIHPNPKKHIRKKTMSPLLTHVVLPKFLGCMALQHHIGGARAFFSSSIDQFLQDLWKWYSTQLHTQPKTQEHAETPPIQWLWQPGWNAGIHQQSLEHCLPRGSSSAVEGDRKRQGRRSGQSKTKSCSQQ